MSRQDASSNYYEYLLLIRAVWLYRPNLSSIISVILHWDGLRFRSSRGFDKSDHQSSDYY